MLKLPLTLIFTGGMLLNATAQADTLSDWLTSGHSDVDIRYRLENVSQDNALKDAHASTARIRAGYQTGDLNGFFADGEVQGLGVIGPDRYNSTYNHLTNYATVADPGITEPDQLYLGYRGVPQTTVKYGQQRIQLDNERFIGNVGWRQIEQTYDAFSVVNTSLPDTTINAAYLSRVHRVFGDYTNAPPGTFSSQSPILNIHYQGIPHLGLSAYSYLIDLHNIAPALLPAYASTRTNGLRATGSTPIGPVTKLLYSGEYAYQSNGWDNHLASFGVRYYLGELGIECSGMTVKISQELLGSNGTMAFQTPLATLHAFNGWADMFLQTPQQGLKDSFATLGYDFNNNSLSVIYHDFRSDQKDSHYGTEWDAQALHHFGTHYTVGAAVGAYHNINLITATAYAAPTPSTTKAWLWGQINY